jgi:hypothetical protein
METYYDILIVRRTEHVEDKGPAVAQVRTQEPRLGAELLAALGKTSLLERYRFIPVTTRVYPARTEKLPATTAMAKAYRESECGPDEPAPLLS